MLLKGPTRAQAPRIEPTRSACCPSTSDRLLIHFHLHLALAHRNTGQIVPSRIGTQTTRDVRGPLRPRKTGRRRSPVPATSTRDTSPLEHWRPGEHRRLPVWILGRGWDRGEHQVAHLRVLRRVEADVGARWRDARVRQHGRLLRVKQQHRADWRAPSPLTFSELHWVAGEHHDADQRAPPPRSRRPGVPDARRLDEELTRRTRGGLAPDRCWPSASRA